MSSSKTVQQRGFQTPGNTADLILRLNSDPYNKKVHSELCSRLRDPKDFGRAANSVYGKSPEKEGKGFVAAVVNAVSGKPVWTNWLGSQTCYPVSIKHPKSLAQLIAAVKEAIDSNTTVRCVGSGHSFSDVAVTDGILLDPHGMKKVLNLDASILTATAATNARNLVLVESGITLRELNDILDARRLGLINMGSYDAQTLAGAISTGTHGTGLNLGPMASFVRSIVIVDCYGAVYQVESASNPITDPEKFRQKHPRGDVVLKQDDAWFRTCLVGMGCVGLIYSYVIEVREAYHLEEDRVAITWEDAKPLLRTSVGGEIFPDLMTKNRHFELDVNPYAVRGVHSGIMVTKNISPGPGVPVGGRGIKNWFNGLLAGWDAAQMVLANLLNALPWISPDIIGSALQTLINRDYIDKSFRVMNVGIGDVEAMALELSIPYDGWIETVDRLLEIFADEAKNRAWYLAGPVALRFVAPAEAYLAPQQGRYTVMAELTMLAGVESGEELVKSVRRRICTPGSGIRVHWGLDLDTITKEEVRGMYPEFGEWEKVYRVLNATGRFNNRLTERLGISMGSN